jgi:Domain of Unknown Function (DUF1206)
MSTMTAPVEGHLAPSTTGHSWVRTVGRIGIGSRGLIYLILAYLAFDIARHGSAPAQATSTGALEEIGHRNGGSVLLALLAVGLGSYAIWRLFNAAVSQVGTLKRLGSVAIAIIYLGLLTRAVELASGHKTSGGAAANPQPFVVKALGWPAGKVIVGGGGAALVIAGVGLGLWGVFHRYSKSLALEQVSHGWRRMIQTLGALGDLARGFLFALVGSYLIGTAVSGNASQAKGVDQALRALVRHPYGAALIGAAALGLLSFGMYSFFEARFRRFFEARFRRQ